MPTRTDWSHAFAARTHRRRADELAAILAGGPSGVLSMTGGFPNAATFPTDVLDAIAVEVLREAGGAALQYAPCEGLPSVREYLVDRQEQQQGVRPQLDELMVTSGGMECLALACMSLIDPGDAVAVESPTYLGALMAFRGAEAQIHGIPMDDDGLRVDVLEQRLAGGLRPKLLYVIPEFQNPTGRRLALDRRHALVDLCRHHGVLVLEDVAYRELAFDGSTLPSLWSLAPDVVVQSGTFSKLFFPGVRLGWAVGPQAVVAQFAAAKLNTDQCSAALGQRLLEVYGRAGHFERHLSAARALYAAHWRALGAALRRHMPDSCRWTEPEGGFLTWLTLPERLDAGALRPAAAQAGVAYVPGAPFHPDDAGANTLRLSFSHLDEADLAVATERLAGVVRDA